MSRPTRENPSLRSRARSLATTLAHRVRLTDGARTTHDGAFTLADWRFLAEASIALDDASSLDDLQAVVLRLVVPRVADFCVLRIHAGLAAALGSPARSAHGRPELLPFLRRTRPVDGELLSRRHPANRVQVTGMPNWGDVDEHRLELIARDSQHLALLRAMGPKCAMVVPLARRGRMLGSLTLVTTRHSGRRYARADVALASELARRAAIALERCAQHEGARRALTDQRVLLAMTSHDLKDPLATIQLALELVRERSVGWLQQNETANDELVRSQLEAAAGAGVRMRRLIERTLDETGVGGIEERAVQSERPTLRLLEGSSSSTCQRRGRATSSSAWKHTANLIGNALKFTPAGGRVVVMAKAVDHGVTFTVADTGLGIPVERQSSVLAPEWRPKRSSASGLGLRIARTIVRAAGGDIGFQPSAGGGTAFWVTVPTR